MTDWSNDCDETATGCETGKGKPVLENSARVASNKTDWVNFLDSAYGYSRKGESVVKEIINFWKQDKSPNKLKQAWSICLSVQCI